MARRHKNPHRSHPVLSVVSSLSDFEEHIPIMVGSASRKEDNHRGRYLIQSCRRVVSSRRRALLVLLMGVGVLTISWTNIRTGQSNRQQSKNDTSSLQHSNITDNNDALIQALNEFPFPMTYEELSYVNEELATLEPRFILHWAHQQLQLIQSKDQTTHLRNQREAPMVQVTSFGPSGLVVLHLLSQLHMLNDVPVVTLDTLHLFKESYEFYDTVQQSSKFNGMELTITKPIRRDDDGDETEIQTRQEFDEIYGADLWKTEPEQYVQLTKQEPLEKLTNSWHVKMWITGRRRSQGGERTNLKVLEFASVVAEGDDNHDHPFDLSKGTWKLNPLAYWSYSQVWEHIRHYNLPYNSLYDKGYTSLGDEMTTDLPTGSDERSGRFVGMNRTECGLHSHRNKIHAEKEQALAKLENVEAPKLDCKNCIELNVDNFEDVVTNSLRGDEQLLVEFYSPYCGGCQAFAPILNLVADHLTSEGTGIKVSRFDITEHDAPTIANEDFFHVEVTPTMFRVRHPFSVEEYKGEHTFDNIVTWLKRPKDAENTTKRRFDMLRKKENRWAGHAN